MPDGKGSPENQIDAGFGPQIAGAKGPVTFFSHLQQVRSVTAADAFHQRGPREGLPLRAISLQEGGLGEVITRPNTRCPAATPLARTGQPARPPQPEQAPSALGQTLQPVGVTVLEDAHGQLGQGDQVAGVVPQDHLDLPRVGRLDEFVVDTWDEIARDVARAMAAADETLKRLETTVGQNGLPAPPGLVQEVHVRFRRRELDAVHSCARADERHVKALAVERDQHLM